MNNQICRVTIADCGNKPAALERAMDAQDALKVVVRITRDGFPVLIHDPLIGDERVESLTLLRLSQLDPEIVTLRWLLDRCRGRDALVVLEISYRGGGRSPGRTEEIVLEELERARRLTDEWDGLTVVSSYSPACLLELARQAPAIPRLQLLDSLRVPPKRIEEEAGSILNTVERYAIGIGPDVTDLLTVPWVELAHTRGLGVFPYAPPSITTPIQHLDMVELTAQTGCDGGHFVYPEMYRDALGDDALPAAEAMRRFLAMRDAAALRSPARLDDASIRRLAAQLVTMGEAHNLSITDLHDAAAHADTLLLADARALGKRCADEIAARMKR
jgi:glycerophosphoryl diester phosphodiesterase